MQLYFRMTIRNSNKSPENTTASLPGKRMLTMMQYPIGRLHIEDFSRARPADRVRATDHQKTGTLQQRCHSARPGL